jgi:hypothetical protein
VASRTRGRFRRNASVGRRVAGGASHRGESHARAFPQKRGIEVEIGRDSVRSIEPVRYTWRDFSGALDHRGRATDIAGPAE